MQTTTESGFPGVKFNGMWLGFFGPGKMPRDRLDVIATEVDKVLEQWGKFDMDNGLVQATK